MKDTALSKGARLAINTQIKEYGEMLKFNLDSKKKTIDVEVMLDGEKEPLSVYIENYKLSEQGYKHYVTLKGIRTSRAWINAVASSYLEGKSFEVPAEYMKILKVAV